MNKKIRIAIVGPYPPPLGGISLHIQRLKQHLENAGMEFTIYKLGASGKEGNKSIIPIKKTKAWLLRLLFHAGDHEIIHLSCGSSWVLRVYFGLILHFLERKKYIVTWHGNDITWPYAVSCLRKPALGLRARFITWLVLNSFKRADFVICVNPQGRDLLISKGVKPERVEVIPSFIPPAVKEDEIAEVPKEVWDFIRSHKPVISANASAIRFYNGQDLYGIDMCIDLCANLKSAYPEIGFIFCLPDIGDYEYFHKMKQRIVKEEIEDNFLFQTKACQFYPILMKSDVFVRPTNTDGDAVSLREALYFKVPSIVSDAVPRPEGTILFRSRDIDDFISKVKDVLSNYDKYKKKLEKVMLEDNAEKIIKVYQGLAKGLRGMESLLVQIRGDGILNFARKALRFLLRKTIGLDWRTWIIVERSLEDPLEEIEPRIEVTIRQARSSDLDKFKRLVNEEKLVVLRERFKKGRTCFIALDGDKIAYFGWISVDAEYESNSRITMRLKEKEAYWFDCYTAPKYRQNGLHTALTSKALTYLKDRGYKTVLTIVWDENTPSRKAFRIVGFKGQRTVTLITVFGIKFHLWHKFKGRL